MSIRTATIALGVCTLFLVLGLALGQAAVISDLIATMLSAGGFASGLVLVALIGLRVSGMGRTRVQPVSEDPRVHELIGELAALADASAARGYLALAEARADLADGLVRHGCEMVITAADRRDVLESMALHADPLIVSESRRGRLIGVCASATAFLAVLAVFVLLVWTMGAAVEPSGVDAALAIAVVSAAFGAFGIVVAVPAVIRRMNERIRVRELLAQLATEGVLAISSGLGGIRVREMLDAVAIDRAGTAPPDVVVRAVAA